MSFFITIPPKKCNKSILYFLMLTTNDVSIIFSKEDSIIFRDKVFNET